MSARDPRLSKLAVERRIFEAVAPLIGWTLIPGSIQQPNPPQPDILCDVAERGVVAVELVALDDDATRRRLSHMFGTRRAWDEAMEKWPAATRAVLDADLRDAHISANFHNDAGRPARTAALYELQRYLMARPKFIGEVSAEDLGFPRGFDGARVFRGGRIPGGPHVSSPSGGYWCPPNVGKIVEKLREKAYEPAAPMELFAYATHDDPDGSVGSLQAIQTAVAQHLPGSLFERVHVFHVGFRQHIWSSP